MYVEFSSEDIFKSYLKAIHLKFGLRFCFQLSINVIACFC